MKEEEDAELAAAAAARAEDGVDGGDIDLMADFVDQTSGISSSRYYWHACT